MYLQVVFRLFGINYKIQSWKKMTQFPNLVCTSSARISYMIYMWICSQSSKLTSSKVHLLAEDWQYWMLALSLFQIGAGLLPRPHQIMTDPQNSLPIGYMYGIFTYIWLMFMVNVGKYTIHGSYGLYRTISSRRSENFSPQTQKINFY